MTPEAIQSLLSDMTEEQKNEIKQHLPAAQQTEAGIRENLLSPQLRQALRSLTEACQTSEENVLMMLMMCDLDSNQ